MMPVLEHKQYGISVIVCNCTVLYEFAIFVIDTTRSVLYFYSVLKHMTL